jgi:hypothetical protein
MQKQTRRARSRHGSGLLPGVAPRSHWSTRMRLLFEARTGGSSSLAAQDSTGTPTTLELHISYVSGNGQEKESHQNASQRLETLTPLLGTDVSVHFYTYRNQHSP